MSAPSPDPLRDLEIAAHCFARPEFQLEARYDGQGDELSDLVALVEAVRADPLGVVDGYQHGFCEWTSEFIVELVQASR